MASEKFECGCEITFDAAGAVRGVSFCVVHDGVFSQDKSLRQLAIDLHMRLLTDRHAPPPPPVPEPVKTEPAVRASESVPTKKELPSEGGSE